MDLRDLQVPHSLRPDRRIPGNLPTTPSFQHVKWRMSFSNVNPIT
jgi:hypothetical protein